MRALLSIALVLAFAGTAWAQEPPEAPGLPAPIEAGVDGDEDGELEEEEDGEGEDVCERGGADAEYGYCEPCPDGADKEYAGADETYACYPSSAGGPGPRRRPAGEARALPAATTLPLTGGEPLVLALLGIGLVSAGAGARLLLRRPAPASSAARSPLR